MKLNNKNNIGIIKTYTLTVSIGLLLTLIALILIISYIYYPSFRKELTFISAIIGGFSTLYSAIYIAISLKDQIHRNTIANAMDISKNISQMNMTKIKEFIEKKISITTTSEFHGKIVDDHELFIALRKLLAALDNASIGVQSGFVDEKTLYSSLVVVVTVIFDRFRPYITEERKIYTDERIYCEFELLADSWKRGILLTTGKKID